MSYGRLDPQVPQLHIPKPPKGRQKPVIMAFTRKCHSADEARNTVRDLNLDPDPQTLKYTGFEGIQFDEQGMLLPHSILGSLEDFRSYLEDKGETELMRRIPTSQRDPLPEAPKRPHSEGVEKRMYGLNLGSRNTQSNALQRWHAHMAGRRRQQNILSDSLDRPIESLLMHQSNCFRETQEQRELLKHAMPLIFSGHGDRVGSEFWTVPPYCGNEISGIRSTLTRTEQGRREPITRVGIPRSIRKESGMVCAEPLRPASRSWKQSAYLQHQYQELGEDMDTNKPDVDGLEVIGSNKPSAFVTVSCSPLTEKEEEEKEHREMKMETLDVLAQNDDLQTDALLIPALRFCGQLACWTGNSPTNQGDVGINATIFFEAMTGEKVSSQLELHNEGITAIFYSWQRLLLPCSFPNLRSQPKTPCFCFLSSSGVILPGETLQIEFSYKSREAGIRTELWQLNTHPLLLQGASMQVMLRGVALCQDKRPFLEEQRKLEKRVMVELCQSIVYEMLQGIQTPERPSSPADFYITEEQVFLKENPKLQYRHQPVEDLKRLWQEMSPGGSWDFSFNTLRQVVLSLPDESDQEKHLAQINSMFLQLCEPSDMTVQKAHLTVIVTGQLLWRKLLDDMVVEAMQLKKVLGIPERDTWSDDRKISPTSTSGMAEDDEKKGGAANKGKSKSKEEESRKRRKTGKKKDEDQKPNTQTDTQIDDMEQKLLDIYTKLLHKKVYALMEDLVNNLCDVMDELKTGDDIHPPLTHEGQELVEFKFY